MRLLQSFSYLKSPLFLAVGALLFITIPTHPNQVRAQVVRGHLYDSETGGPVVNGTVALRNDLGAVVARTSSDQAGRFELNAPGPGLYSLLAVGMGYRSAPSGQFQVGAEGELTVDLTLDPQPIEIPGIGVEARTFAERLENVQTDLDERLARLPGKSRIATPDRIRLYDRTHAKDPWRLLWRELRVPWSFNLIEGGGYEVYIDDRRTWMVNLVLTPNSSFCRVERYTPPPHPTVDQVPPQLRAYTCQFLAHVASGTRTMRSSINWGDLIAGPGAFANMTSGEWRGEWRWGGREE